MKSCGLARPTLAVPLPYCDSDCIGSGQAAALVENVKLVTEVEIEAPAPTPSVTSDGTNEIGTYVFGAFAVISLLVSIVKGVVPFIL